MGAGVDDMVFERKRNAESEWIPGPEECPLDVFPLPRTDLAAADIAGVVCFCALEPRGISIRFEKQRTFTSRSHLTTTHNGPLDVDGGRHSVTYSDASKSHTTRSSETAAATLFPSHFSQASFHSNHTTLRCRGRREDKRSTSGSRGHVSCNKVHQDG